MNTFCLLKIKTQGPGSGNSQKRPWLRGTLLREPWGMGRIRPWHLLLGSCCGSAGTSGPAAAGSLSVSSRRCCGASSGPECPSWMWVLTWGFAVMEGCACTCYRRGPGQGPRPLGLRELLQRARRGGVEIGAQLSDSPRPAHCGATRLSARCSQVIYTWLADPSL